MSNSKVDFILNDLTHTMMEKVYLKVITSLTIFMFLGTFLSAQTIVRGKVTDAETGEPLIAAQVYADGTPAFTETDDEGNYEIQIPYQKDQTYQLVRFQYLGYAEFSDFIRVTPDGKLFEVEQDVKLESQTVKLEDVFVTANKVKEEMQDVPIAISVVNTAEIRQKNANNVEEAFQSIPNLITDSYLPGSFTFTLRGLNSDFVNAGIENSVGLYIDDIFYSRSHHFNSSLMDIERLEVLKGPQGTLFGKNTIGGVLHVITEKPQMANFGSVEFTGGNYSLFLTRAKANFMLIKDKLAMRVTGAYKQKDGFTRIIDNERASEQNKTQFAGGRLSLLYTPNERVNVNLKYEKSKNFKAEFPLDFKQPEFGGPIPAQDDDFLNRETRTDFDDPFFERNINGFSGKADIKLGDRHTLTLLSGYHTSDSGGENDFDHTELDFTNILRTIDYKTRSHEIRIATPRKNAKLFYVGGLFYLKERIQSRDRFTFGQAWIPVFRNVAGLPASFDVPNYSADGNSEATQNVESFAVFGSTSYEVSEKVRVNAGLRFTSEDRNLSYFQQLNPGTPINFIQFILQQIGSEDAPQTREAQRSFVSGNLGMDFKTSDNFLIYVNVSRGFKGAGFNTTLSPTERSGGLIFEPESINSYEIGLKMKTDNRHKINTAAFATVYKDKQEFVVAGQSTQVVNAESAEGVGVESEWTAIWSDHFRTDMAVGGQSLKYFDFPFVDLIGQPVNLSGNSLYKSPNFTFRFTPQFTGDFGSTMKFLARVDYNFTSKSYNDVYNTESLARDPFHMVNARLGVSSKDEKYSIAIWGRNLIDQTYIQHVWPLRFWSRVALNPPRTFGVEFRINIY